ncbi:MAG: S1C family serine protease [Candidatus Aenigmatarchaeota archaeon]
MLNHYLSLFFFSFFFLISPLLGALKFEEILKGVVIISGIVEPQAYLGFSSKSNFPEAYRWHFQKDGASGFVIEYMDKTLVISNSHVVELFKRYSGNRLAVVTIDGNVIFCNLLGGDSFYDIAVLEVPQNSLSFVKPLPFRPSSNPLTLGEDVFAIGHPLLKDGNFQFTITKGIVSGLNRRVELPTSRFNLIQHTARLASGNSGGPLIDANGFVCGINTLGSVSVDFINYAIDINFLLSILPELLSHGTIQRAYLGLEFSSLQIADENSFKKTFKIVVSDILKNSPVANYFKPNDEIVAINNSKITDIYDLIEALETIKPNSQCSFTVLRGNKPLNFTFVAKKIDDDDFKEISNFILSNYADFSFKFHDNKPFITEKKIAKPINFASFYGRLFKVENVSDLGKILKNALLSGSVSVFSLPEGVNPFELESSTDDFLQILRNLFDLYSNVYEIEFGEPNSIYIY